MRSLYRNKRTFWYANPEGFTDATDSNGYYTGEKTTTYSTPAKLFGNISVNTNVTVSEMFGVVSPYEMTINPMSLDCPMDEGTVLWIGIEPPIEGTEASEETTPSDSLTPSEGARVAEGYNYIVKRKARSLNFTAYLVSKVEVS